MEDNLMHLRFCKIQGIRPERARRVIMAAHGIGAIRLAAELGLKPATVSHTLNGIRHNPKIQERIAGFFRVPREEFFPASPDGLRRDGSGSPDGLRRGGPGESEELRRAEAA